MKFFKAILSFFKKLLKKLLDFIKKYWWLILALLVIWFAPAISTWLAGAGAPSWLTSTFTWIASNITPSLVSLGQWVGGGVVSGWSWFKSLSIGQMAAVGFGAMAMISPDSAKEVVEGAIEDITTIGGAVVGGVTSVVGSALSTPLKWLGFGLLAWVVLKPKDQRGAA